MLGYIFSDKCQEVVSGHCGGEVKSSGGGEECDGKVGNSKLSLGEAPL